MKTLAIWQKMRFALQQSSNLSRREKITLSVAVSALLASTLFIFGPITMYAGNANELWFPLSVVLPMLLVVALGVFIFMAILAYCLPVRLSRYIIAMVFGLGIAFYIEGTFMPMDYGLLDGKVVEWSKYADRIFYDNIIWSLCITLPLMLLLFKSNLFKKLVPIACTILILMQGGGLIGVLPSMPGKTTSNYLTDEGKYTLGKKENIVVIVLDCFDHRMLERSIKNSKELGNSLKDFIHYENSMSPFNYTKPSIPSILTGIPYDNSIPFNEYINFAYEEYPLLKMLFNSGYDSRLFTYHNFTPMNNARINTYIANKKIIDDQMKKRLAFLLCQLALMRKVPLFLKDTIWLSYDSFEKVKSKAKALRFSNYGEDINSDLAFYRQLKRNGLAIIAGKAFRFYHFQGAHDYINMDSDLNVVKDYENADLARLNQAEGSLKIAAEYLKEMKNAGVYENSTIIITGDHGLVSDPTMAYFLAPVLLIKNKNASFNSIKKSSAPVMNSDIAATIMEIIRPDNGFGGTPIHQIAGNSARIRKFYFLNGYASARKGYLQDMLEFTNENFTILPQDFKKTGNVFSDKGIKKNKYNYYPLGYPLKSEDITHDWNSNKGDKLFYGERAVIGGADLYSGDVFKTAGTCSTMGFTLSETGRDLPVTMVAASAFAKSNPQRLYIEVNGTKLPDKILFENNEFKMVKFVIPHGLIKKDKALTLSLLTPNARQVRNPFESLVYFKEALVIKLLVMGNANPPQQILFGAQEKNNSGFYKGKGWHENENKHTWSSEKAELFLPLHSAKDAVLDFRLIYPHGQNYVKININGHDLGFWNEEISGNREWEYHKILMLPQQFLAKDGMNELVLSVSALPPSGAETRILGLPVMSITIK